MTRRRFKVRRLHNNFLDMKQTTYTREPYKSTKFTCIVVCLRETNAAVPSSLWSISKLHSQSNHFLLLLSGLSVLSLDFAWTSSRIQSCPMDCLLGWQVQQKSNGVCWTNSGSVKYCQCSAEDNMYLNAIYSLISWSPSFLVCSACLLETKIVRTSWDTII